MQCNIDAKGKRARFIYGAIMLLIGVILLLAWALPTSSSFAWIVTILVILSGAFGLFEARAGWCAVRAMGFKTRM